MQGCRATARNAPPDVLSAREVLALTAAGSSSTEAGERLRISGKAVDTYRRRVMAKPRLRHRSEPVRPALRAGLLAPG